MEYLYEEVDYQGLNTLTGSIHREIIDDYAKQGFRYVGYIPTKQSSHGQNITVDLIFEKIHK